MAEALALGGKRKVVPENSVIKKIIVGVIFKKWKLIRNIHYGHFKQRPDPTPHLHKHLYRPCLALILALVPVKLYLRKQMAHLPYGL